MTKYNHYNKHIPTYPLVNLIVVSFKTSRQVEKKIFYKIVLPKNATKNIVCR